MKTLFRKTIVLSAILIASNFFMSCNKKDIKAELTTIIEPIHNDINSDIYEDEVSEKMRTPLVFITGFDKRNETFYDNARAYYKEKNYQIVEDQYSLEEIINWLNRNSNDSIYGEIHIVNKSNPYKGLTLETLINGEKVTTESVRKSITKGTLPFLNESVTSNSKIIFHANGLGENESLMKTLRDAFCAEEVPNLVASPYHTVFDGEFSPHYLAKAFYVFYPTANSPGKVDLSKEIARKYSDEDLDWYEALNNDAEQYIGQAYTKKFTIPVKFQLDYHNSDEEVPSFETQEEIMDFIEQEESLITELKKLNIPTEKFRWTYSLKNSTLTIKGKTSGLCVLQPLIKPYGELEHVKPDTNNKRLYAMK